MTDFQSEVQERRLFITYSFFKASIASSICASTSDYLIIIPNVLEDFENVSNVFRGFDPHDSSSQGSCQMYLGGFDPDDSSSQGSCLMHHGGFDPHDSFSHGSGKCLETT